MTFKQCGHRCIPSPGVNSAFLSDCSDLATRKISLSVRMYYCSLLYVPFLIVIDPLHDSAMSQWIAMKCHVTLKAGSCMSITMDFEPS